MAAAVRQPGVARLTLEQCLEADRILGETFRPQSATRRARDGSSAVTS